MVTLLMTVAAGCQGRQSDSDRRAGDPSTTDGDERAGDAAGNYLSIHANCWTKNWLTERDTSRSFLFDQRVKAAPRARYSRPLGQPRDY